MRKGNWGQSPKGWTDIGSDLCWEDHGGTWCKRDTHASGKRVYWVLRFSNWTDEMREGDDDRPYYEASTAWVDLDDSSTEIASALRSCGWSRDEQGRIVNDHDGAIVAEGKHADYAILSALAGYGLDWDHMTSDRAPRRLRARAAKSC